MKQPAHKQTYTRAPPSSSKTQQVAAAMIPYIRVKRRNQTVFLDVHFSDTFASVKEKLGALFHLSPSHIQLWAGLNQVRARTRPFVTHARLQRGVCSIVVTLRLLLMHVRRKSPRN